jgi:hypothetical protein
VRAGLILAAGLVATVPAHGAGICDAELVVAEIRLREASDRLAAMDRSSPRRCAVFRDHVRVMQAARDTFQRCTSGFHARETIAQMQGSIADWQEIIARTCR